ncbi:MAG: DUF971 domain-containing protein [Pseudomonadota bacterium]
MADPPESLTLRRGSRLLIVDFGGDRRYELPFEFLRVMSPSAEVRGHGPGQGTLPTGKEEVTIVRVEPVGHYAVRLVFDDGHNSGLYTWAYLSELGATKAEKWRDYLDRLRAEGYARKPSASSASECGE